MFIRTSMRFLLFTICFTYGYENIALNKPTHQSNRYYSEKFGRATFESSNAVDGLKTNLSAFGGQCAISKDKYYTATWWVNLTSIHSIHSIKIYYRTDNADWGPLNGYTARFLGFYLYVSNTTERNEKDLCFHDESYSKSTIPAVVNISCPVHGQYVIYFNKRPQNSTNAAQFYTFAHNELCEVEVYGCNKTGVYGPDCSLTCPRNCLHPYCHIETGACQGCKPGYQGHHCKLHCTQHFYGEDCMKKCGNCSDGVTCNHINGKCINGCGLGVYGDKCKLLCPLGWHGKNCSESCINCERCDRISGRCTSPCHSGWKGENCTDKCDGQMYGQNCKKECGACLEPKQCHHIYGNCTGRCGAGYKGIFCKTECTLGTFGNNCNQNCSANCIVPKRCNRTTGECKGGCKRGWKGLHCDNVCTGNMYGFNCSQSCGHCHVKTCNRINGTCLNGCDKGFKGVKCLNSCSSNTYGFNCLKNCSTNCINNTCDSVTGDCPLKKKSTQPFISSTAGSVIGGISGLFIACILIVVLILFLKRRSQGEVGRPKQSKTETKGAESTSIDPKSISNKQKSKQRDSEIHKHSKHKKKADEADVDEDELIHSENPYGDFYANETTIRDIPLNQLESVITEKRKDQNDGFQREYATLPYGELHKCDDGKREENMVKNRYKTTFPYDHSRVKLRTSSGSDYVNANYIEGADWEREYIAAQGPKQNTLGDFWTMIWQENVFSIVMVTNLKEGTKVKCNQYWPDPNKNINFGAVSVKLIEEKEYAFYIVRRMIACHNELKESRTVTQYHYTAWPDHGTPESLCLVVFLDHVRRTSTNQNNSATIVHCSAGIGRTGTYIALDALKRIGQKRKKVNVAEYVKKMRENRMNMVQTYEQYMTVFLALNEIFKAPINSNTIENFTKKAGTMTMDEPANQSVL